MKAWHSQTSRQVSVGSSHISTRVLLGGTVSQQNMNRMEGPDMSLNILLICIIHKIPGWLIHMNIKITTGCKACPNWKKDLKRFKSSSSSFKQDVGGLVAGASSLHLLAPLQQLMFLSFLTCVGFPPWQLEETLLLSAETLLPSAKGMMVPQWAPTSLLICSPQTLRRASAPQSAAAVVAVLLHQCLFVCICAHDSVCASTHQSAYKCTEVHVVVF